MCNPKHNCSKQARLFHRISKLPRNLLVKSRENTSRKTPRNQKKEKTAQTEKRDSKTLSLQNPLPPILLTLYTSICILVPKSHLPPTRINAYLHFPSNPRRLPSRTHAIHHGPAALSGDAPARPDWCPWRLIVCGDGAGSRRAADGTTAAGVRAIGAARTLARLRRIMAAGGLNGVV